MKKLLKINIFIISIALVLLITIFNTGAVGETFSYKWTNTYIEIPVGESIDKYKDIPEAKLYRDNVLLSDTSISYDQEGCFMYYFKNVNTTKTGTYKVYYKAFEKKYNPGTCLNYRVLITFHVVDKTPPKLNIINRDINLRRGNTIDFNDNITCSDNYSNCVVSFQESVDFNKVGSYEVLATVKDDSGNYTSDKFTVNIFSDSKPVITCNLAGDTYKIPYNGEYDIKSIFKAVDEIDGDITDSIVFPKVKNNELGEYDYTVSVTNSSGYDTKYTIKIDVIDDEAPELILSTHSIILSYKTDLYSDPFRRYVRVVDNKDIDYNNLTIIDNCINEVGSYEVIYSYTDGVFNVSDSLDVTFLSFEPPKIYIDDILVNTNENVDLLNYITVEDPSDNLAYLSLDIDDSLVSYDKEGTYYAKAYCINSSGLSTEKRFRVIVKNDSLISNSNMPLFIIIIVLSTLVIGFIILSVFVLVKFRKKMIWYLFN